MQAVDRVPRGTGAPAAAVVPGVAHRLGGLSALLWVGLAAGAVWPVWPYLLRGWLSPGADPAPGVVFLGALAWALYLWRSAKSPVAPAPGWPLPLLLALYAAGYHSLPPLARTMLGLAAFGAAVQALPGLGWRHRSGLVALFVLVFNLLVDVLYAVIDPRVRYE